MLGVVQKERSCRDDLPKVGKQSTGMMTKVEELGQLPNLVKTSAG